jgi:hypothetical protein
MGPFDNTNKSIIVRGESNFHQDVVDSNLPGISLTGQDTFNVCNNCIFHGKNNLNENSFCFDGYSDISFSSCQP